MDSIQTARSVLEAAEVSLRKIAAETLESKRYAEVAEIARFADGLSSLLALSESHPTVEPVTSPPGRGAADREVATSGRVSRKIAQGASARPRKGRYPKFVRDESRLVKIGWSKKKRQSYEHRSAKDSVMAVVERLSDRQSRRSPFRIEEVMPVRSAGSKADVPAYAVYLTIAWLQQGGVIRKRGREGYAVVSKAGFRQAAEQLWDATPMVID